MLQRATGPALVSWPVLLVVVAGSAQVSALGTGSTADGSTLTRAAIGAAGGIGAYLLVVSAWWGVLSRVNGISRVALAVGATALAGLVRGLIVQDLLTSLGMTSPDTSQLVLRLVTGTLIGPVAFLGTAAGVATVRDFRETSQLLSMERQRLITLLDASTERIEQRQADTLARVQSRLDRELHEMAMDSAPSAVAALESLAGDVVRPLSHALARDLPQWDDDMPLTVPRVRLIDVWRESVPSVAIHPTLLAGVLLAVTLPASVIVYEPRYGVAALIGAIATLWLALSAGRQWILYRPPRTSRRGWLRIIVVLVSSALAASAVAALLDRGDPSAGVFSRLALGTVVAFGLIIAVVAMQGHRMRETNDELASVTRQLRWSLARVNTEQWEQSGLLSRALHGPVQTLLHSRLLRLRRQIDHGEVDQARLDSLRDDLQRALAGALAPADRARPIAGVLDDVAEAWAGVADVTWEVTPGAAASLAADQLCTRALSHLTTEAVSNAVRHGAATTVDIDICIDIDEADLIVLHVVDNGTVPDTRMPGMGTVLLSRCTYDWSLRSDKPTSLTARLPVVPAAQTQPAAVF